MPATNAKTRASTAKPRDCALACDAATAGRRSPRRGARSDRLRRGIGTLCGFLLSAATIVACRGAPEPPPPTAKQFDLAAELAFAQTPVDTIEIDFGTPAARRHLIQGWGVEEKSGRFDMNWGLSPRSSVWFYATRPRSIEMSFRCFPFEFDGAPEQRVTISVNERHVATTVIEPSMREYTIELPREAIRAGRNIITFDYAYGGRAFTPEQGDQRPLAVGWDWLRLAGAAPPVEVEANAGALSLPIGGRVDYFLRPASGAALRLDRVEAWGPDSGAPARLAVAVEATGKPARELAAAARAGDVLPLPFGGEIVRLTLSAEGAAAQSPADAGLYVSGAVVEPAAGGGVGDEAGGAVARWTGEGKPNVILYLIDTLRADHLGCYGYDRDVSPNIDAFARDALRFERAVAQSSWTRPAVASVLTGLSLRRHNVVNLRAGLSDAATTIAEALREAGYATGAFVLNPQVTEGMGFAQGFDEFVTDAATSRGPAPSRWIGERVAAARPFFFFFHEIDPHTPYVADEPFRDRHAAGIDPGLGDTDYVQGLNRQAHRARLEAMRRPAAATAPGDEADHLPGVDDGEMLRQLRALYDAEIAAVDTRFQQLVAELRRTGAYERSVIVVVADHGEEFLDHGLLSHGQTLYQEQLHVPLIIRFPGRDAPRGVTDILARQIDIMPTILDYIGATPARDVEGRSLLPAIAAPDTTPQAPAFATLDWLGVRAESIQVDDLKLIHHRELRPWSPQFELYDLSADPGERDNLFYRRPILAGYMLAQMKRRDSAVRTERSLESEVVDLEREGIAERLRALGYLE